MGLARANYKCSALPPRREHLVRERSRRCVIGSAKLQNRQDGFRWSAERRLVTDHDDWALYQNRVLDHKRQPCILRSIVFGRQPVFFGDDFFEPDNVLRPLTQEFEKPL